MPTYRLGTSEPSVPPAGRAWIAPSADVIGACILGDEASVWFGAVIRGDNEIISIGARTNIQDGAVLHSDRGSALTVGSDCTVGHRAILHGCTIGDRCLVGMAATILNDARIGEECLVGANALVTEGKTFPPRSLILGSPARAVRTLDDQAIAGILAAAAGYVANWRRFAAELRAAAG